MAKLTAIEAQKLFDSIGDCRGFDMIRIKLKKIIQGKKLLCRDIFKFEDAFYRLSRNRKFIDFQSHINTSLKVLELSLDYDTCRKSDCVYLMWKDAHSTIHYKNVTWEEYNILLGIHEGNLDFSIVAPEDWIKSNLIG